MELLSEVVEELEKPDESRDLPVADNTMTDCNKLLTEAELCDTHGYELAMSPGTIMPDDDGRSWCSDESSGSETNTVMKMAAEAEFDLLETCLFNSERPGKISEISWFSDDSNDSQTIVENIANDFDLLETALFSSVGPSKPSSPIVDSVDLTSEPGEVDEQLSSERYIAETTVLVQGIVKIMTLGQKMRFFAWFNHGLSIEEAAAKSKVPGLIPPSARHPNCKFTKRSLHRLSKILPNIFLQRQFIHAAYFIGADPKHIMRCLLMDLGSEILMATFECQFALEEHATKEKQRRRALRKQTAADNAAAAALTSVPNAEASEGHVGSNSEKRTEKETFEVHLKGIRLEGDDLKRYYFWRNQGLPMKEAASTAKFPGRDQGIEPHPDCKHSWEKLLQLAKDLPNEKSRETFLRKVFFEGKDPVRVLKNISGGLITRVGIEKFISWSNSTVEEPRMHPVPEVQSNRNSEVPRLRLNQLKKYYSWRNQGADHSEALANAQTPGMVPMLISHPDCKLSWEGVLDMSETILHKHLRLLFQIEVFYGGKEPGEVMKKILAQYPDRFPESTGAKADIVGSQNGERHDSEPTKDKLVPTECNSELIKDNSKPTDVEAKSTSAKTSKSQLFARPEPKAKSRDQKTKLISHPNCKHSWEEVENMSEALPDKHKRRLFQIDVFYGGKKPEDVMKKILALNQDRSPLKNITANGKNGGQSNCLSESSHINGELQVVELDKTTKVGQKLSVSPKSNVAKADSVVGQNSLAERNVDQSQTKCSNVSCGDDEKKSSPPKKFNPDIENLPGTQNDQPKFNMDKSQKAKQTKLDRVSFVDDPVPPKSKVSKADSVVELNTLAKRIIDKSPSAKQTFDDVKKLPPSAKSNPAVEDTAEAQYDQSNINVGISEKPKQTKRKRVSFPEDQLSVPPKSGVPAADAVAAQKSPFKAAGKPHLIEPTKSNHASYVKTSDDIMELSNRRLKKYYVWRNKGVSHEEAYSKALSKSANLSGREVNELYVAHPKCKYSKDELTEMSSAIPDKLNRERFFIHTFFGGVDPESAKTLHTPQIYLQNVGTSERQNKKVRNIQVNYLMSKGFTREEALKKLRYPSKNLLEELEEVMKINCTEKQVIQPNILHQRPNQNYGELKLPLSSPYHPSKMLSGAQLIKYYLWISSGCSRREAFEKVVNVEPVSSDMFKLHYLRSKYNMDEMKKLSKALPRELATLFVTETFYGQNDPREVMESLLLSYSTPSVNVKLGQEITGNPWLSSKEVQDPVHYSKYNADVSCTVAPALAAGLSYPVHIMPQHEANVGPSTSVPAPVADLPTLLPTPFLGQVAGLPATTHGYLQTAVLVPTKHQMNESPKAKVVSDDSNQAPYQEDSSAADHPPLEDGEVLCFIVPAYYPNEILTESQMNAIENSILEAILEMEDDDTKPSFKESFQSRGRYGIICNDEFSVDWLNKYLRMYDPWEGALLRLITSHSTKIRASALLPFCKGDDDEKILKFIEKQNFGLKVWKWTVVERWDGSDGNTLLDLIVDEESAVILQKCSRISFKLGSAEIVTAQEVSLRSRSQSSSSPKGSPPPLPSSPPPPEPSPPPSPPSPKPSIIDTSLGALLKLKSSKSGPDRSRIFDESPPRRKHRHHAITSPYRTYRERRSRRDGSSSRERKRSSSSSPGRSRSRRTSSDHKRKSKKCRKHSASKSTSRDRTRTETPRKLPKKYKIRYRSMSPSPKRSKNSWFYPRDEERPDEFLRNPKYSLQPCSSISSEDNSILYSPHRDGSLHSSSFVENVKYLPNSSPSQSSKDFIDLTDST